MDEGESDVTIDPTSSESTEPVGEYAAMLAAARAATAGTGEPGANAKPEQPTTPPPAAPSSSTAEARLEAILSGRVERRRSVEDVERRALARAQQDFEAKLAKEREAIEARIRQEYATDLRTKPVETIKRVGADGSDLVTRLVQQTTPEAQLHNKIAELEAKLATLNAPVDERVKSLEEQHKAWQAEIAQQQQRAAEQQFLGLVTEEKYPAIRALYDSDSALMARAQAIADDYCKKTGERACPYGDLLEYLESESRKRVESLAPRLTKLLQQRAGAPVESSTEQNGRKGPRTLSAQGASERRASPKPRSEWTSADEEEAMRAAAADAFAAAKKAAR